jgi:toxin ParE1/3/4
MKLRFTLRATENIIGITDYIRAHNPAAAQRVRSAIYESLQDLILFPHVGRLQQTEGVRKFVTRKYAYSSITWSTKRPRRSSSST